MKLPTLTPSTIGLPSYDLKVKEYPLIPQNDIPVFCPGITDGSLGDMIFFHSYKTPGLVLDLVQDIRAINLLAMKSKKSGVVILGGGIIKHHTLNANLMRNGADYAVYVNTASEYDGSDSGASPEEAISWGKIRMTANPVKVAAFFSSRLILQIHGDASLLFPLLVSQTFAKRQ